MTPQNVEDVMSQVEDAITAAGYGYFQIAIYSTFMFKKPTRTYSVSYAKKFMVNAPYDDFATFKELYDWAMRLTPINDIMYRRFTL